MRSKNSHHDISSRKEPAVKIFSLFLVLVVTCVSFSIAQQKVVHFKKLQEFLPSKEMPGFKRNKATGSTQTVMGMTTSEAAVRYMKPAIDTVQEQTIEIKINDMILMPFAAWGMMYQQQDYENETEEGYEKTVTVKKAYKGVEKSQTGESKSCSLNFAIGNRFNVSIEANGFSNAALLTGLAESMDLDKLSKTEADK